MTINLIDARRGLHNKCLELFADKNIAEKIYRYLCDGIEDCEEAKHGQWRHYEGTLTCSVCHTEIYDDIMEFLGDDVPRYCPNCGAIMDDEESDIEENWYSDEYRRIGEYERDEVEE